MKSVAPPNWPMRVNSSKQCPTAYDTMVGERGVNLSGGQRQRIAIARAIIRDTSILILDEPTSGLDAASEQAVIQALERLMEGRTSVVIAHDLGTIRHADVILVVQESELVEQGTHEALLARNGVYAELYKIQTREWNTSATAQPAGPRRLFSWEL